MLPIENAGVVAAEERAHVAYLLTRYPHELTLRETEDLTNWFDRVATPADVLALAQDPTIAPHYRAFRAAHYGVSGPRRIGRLLVVLGTVAAVAGALSLMAP
ncbi:MULTISPECIES: hypothetical protein [Novosphingobium]|uniref:Anti-sigma factor n=2 Tax=Novosphingobium decolorationis TaxID=2698673 RepID=A0ABX8E4I5_9SPHN|nr:MULTISPECIES: hypothetical protein [Novosphingobium]MED5544066.1 hypothetical protein [Pseudomonadota bacterium]QVM83507.1 hypothetical protein HT578_07220 [Novosphingobium decolorationis]QVM83508.1 hypothetical protein HT578_07230 [Novosphingobium decolorationis]QVM83509.1 hypothetical protein HT578_07240 [Novosphingobium decolorationis]GAM05610.1 hypothetical conserved protein [Novosphingobium sp. MBES04]